MNDQSSFSTRVAPNVILWSTNSESMPCLYSWVEFSMSGILSPSWVVYLVGCLCRLLFLILTGLLVLSVVGKRRSKLTYIYFPFLIVIQHDPMKVGCCRRKEMSSGLRPVFFVVLGVIVTMTPASGLLLPAKIIWCCHCWRGWARKGRGRASVG